VSGHKTDVSLFERYAGGGDNVDLKAFASTYLPKLQQHLKMAQDLEK
jgi:putative membrane protein